MRAFLRSAAAAGLLLAGCSAPAAPDLSGQWGGAEANLRLTPAGGSIEYGCGAGSIDSGWTLGANGRWHATGEHYPGGGPQQIPPEPAPHPAVYRGQARGAQLTFTVVLTDLSDTLGPFTLLRGRIATLHRCL